MALLCSGGILLLLVFCLRVSCTSLTEPRDSSELRANFTCPDGTVINSGLACDGVADCSDGLDEQFCPRKLSCNLDQFSCSESQTECVPLSVLCDGVEDCSSGLDETDCDAVSSDSLCSGNQFPCSLSGPCITLAQRCDGVGNCPNGDDEILCRVPKLIRVSDDVSVSSGETVTLSCEAGGYPPPFVSWRKKLQPILDDPRYGLSVDLGLGNLHIRDARVQDAGEYNCVLSSTLHGTTVVQPSVRVQVIDESPHLCENHLNQKHTEGSFFYTLKPFATGPSSFAAADIIFVVDESGSMAMEHEWIRQEVVHLDVGLKQQGVGVGDRQNLFALVGFGRNDPNDINGVTLTTLAPLDDFLAASQNLQLSGVFEDGYAAIDHALSTVQTRAGTAKQIILVTDEDRGVLRSDLSREVIEQRLSEAGIVLNVVVNHGFLGDPEDPASFALGLNQNRTAYVFDPESSSFFKTVQGGSVGQLFGFGSTLEDYVELAFSVGGLAWDLNQLRERGIFAEAFANAFTLAKIDEVMTVFRVCFRCQCLYPQKVCYIQPEVCRADCVGQIPLLSADVSPSLALAPVDSIVTFHCSGYSSETVPLLSYIWDYPSQNDSNTIVDGGLLTVVSVGPDSKGVYSCTVKDNSSGLSVSANATLNIDTRCILRDESLLTLGDFRLILVSTPDNTTRAADIILLVDESGSMVMEHAWISNMVKQLDDSLMKLSIGVDPRNYFGIVGFGDDCAQELGFGRILTSANWTFTTSENISDFTQDLNTGGRTEDGYSAIETALNGYEFRNGAKQLILITDEDRDELLANLTKEVVEALLLDNQALLNVAVSEEFSGNHLRALGIDSRDNAFIYDPTITTLFRVVEKSGMPVQDSAHGTTSEDYTQLAFQLGGAAWDLSLLRQGSTVAEAFTNAFVQAKVSEIRAQMEECFNCTCTLAGPVCELLPGAANISFCTSQPATPRPTESPINMSIDLDSLVVMPGERSTLTCTVNTSVILGWTFNGGLLPLNTQVIGTRGRVSHLEIVRATEENAGVYSCLAHSPSEAFDGIASAQVTFSDPERELIMELSPLEEAVSLGSNHTISCRTLDAANITWNFDGGDFPSNLVISNSAMVSFLTVVGASEANDGAYTCVAVSDPRGITDDDTAYVTIVEPHLELTIEPNTLEVDAGSSIELLCRAVCDCPDILLNWSKPGLELPLRAEITSEEREMEVTALLSISNVSDVDTGRYVCSAHYRGTTTIREAYVSLTTSPSVVLLVNIGGPSRATIEPGGNHSLLCEVNKNVSQLTWHFNDSPVRVQGADNDYQNGAVIEMVPNNVLVVDVSQRRSLLAILDANDNNSGTYECVAVSSFERTSASVEVVVE